MVGQREEIGNAVFVEHVHRQDDVGAEEDIACKVPELSRRMAVEGDDLDADAGDLMCTGLDQNIDRARIGEQEVPTQRIEWISTAEERGRLQQGVAQKRLVEFRSMNDGAGSLDDR